MKESDRRKMERFQLELPAKLTWLGKEKEGKSVKLLTSNICAGGAFFKTNKTFPIRTDVKLEVILPLEKFKHLKSYVDVIGSVIRKDQQGIAICFYKKYKILPYKIKDT